jgi:hypothetical protein
MTQSGPGDFDVANFPPGGNFTITSIADVTPNNTNADQIYVSNTEASFEACLGIPGYFSAFGLDIVDNCIDTTNITIFNHFPKVVTPW